MTQELWVQILCAAVPAMLTIALTVYLAIRDHKHDKRIDRVAEEQRQIENLRHHDNTDSTARTFIHKYYAKRGLIPLCAIASMYDNVRQYNREMYNDFCCLTIEAQNRVMEYLKLDLRVVAIDDIYQRCYDALHDIALNQIGDDTGLYDNGKYIHRALQHHASQKLPNTHDNKQEYITDILAASYRHEGALMPINYLWTYYNARNSKEINCCHVTNLIAGYIAIYWGTDPEKQNKYYGDPGVCGTEYEIETMEDLFLWTLFYAYTYLVLPTQVHEPIEPKTNSPRQTPFQKIKQKLKNLSAIDVCKEALLWIVRTVYIGTAFYTLSFCILGIQKICAGEIWIGIVSLMLMIIGSVITIILQLLCSGINRESNTNVIQTFAVIGTIVALLEMLQKLLNWLLQLTGSA